MSVNPRAETRTEATSSARIALEDIIAAASEGALRALGARQRVPQKGEGFYIDLHIRCGIPAVALQAGGSLSGLPGLPAAGETGEPGT
jgi:hypothetical protein